MCVCTLQVLPMRTHPMMQMSAHGGYLLFGTKVDTTGVAKRECLWPAPQAVERSIRLLTTGTAGQFYARVGFFFFSRLFPSHLTPKCEFTIGAYPLKIRSDVVG